jgi:transposase
MYARRSRLSPRKQMDLLRMFVAGATARATSEIVGVHRSTATSFFMRLRRLIAGKLPSYELSGEAEADESYLGGAGRFSLPLSQTQGRRLCCRSSRKK